MRLQTGTYEDPISVKLYIYVCIESPKGSFLMMDFLGNFNFLFLLISSSYLFILLAYFTVSKFCFYTIIV